MVHYTLLLLTASIFFSLPIASAASNTTVTCPVDLSYVHTFPWDSSLCTAAAPASTNASANCCQTLLSLIGMGLAIHLRQTSAFQFPTAAASAACLADLQTRLDSLSLRPAVVSTCFPDPAQFAVGPSNCSGVVTVDDWVRLVGRRTALDGACVGDVSQPGSCQACLAAGIKVSSQLAALDDDARDRDQCFYDTVLFAAGVVNSAGPEDPGAAECILGLPLVSSVSSSTKRSRSSAVPLVVGLTVALAAVVLVVAAVGVYLWRRQGRRRDGSQASLKAAMRRRNTGAVWFAAGDLHRATNGFSNKNVIGQGGHGVVYKGELSDGTQVAIKQLVDDFDSPEGEEFKNEVEIISSIKHRNLLPLLGCCLGGERCQRYLVYDYMPNGSLQDHIFATGQVKAKLTWPQRKSIILDVAKGLAYLHHGVKPAIYHRDIKPTNILLDGEMKARVADFGLAKQSREGQTHLTTRVAGTHGYLAPEYALYGQLTEKSDVYSFGIVILEVMSGRKALDMNAAMSSSSSTIISATSLPSSSPPRSSILVTDWAWMLVKSGRTEEVVEKSMRGEGARGIMERFVKVGILCAHVMVALRPTIGDALKMLDGDIDIPELPDRPPPLGHESFQSSFSNWFGSSTVSSAAMSSSWCTIDMGRYH